MDLSALMLAEPDADLNVLLASDSFDFWRDIVGINHHLDHTTGKLTDCFFPHCCRSESYRKACEDQLDAMIKEERDHEEQTT